MNDNKLVDELINSFIGLKKAQIRDIISGKKLTHNELLILFILHNMSKEDNRIPLSVLRDKMMLAPSTITPIITSLENNGFIERFIDKGDRRNIFIEITEKGKSYTLEVFKEISSNLSDYINYLGDKDTKEIIRLISKTTKYFEERKEIK